MSTVEQETAYAGEIARRFGAEGLELLSSSPCILEDAVNTARISLREAWTAAAGTTTIGEAQAADALYAYGEDEGLSFAGLLGLEDITFEQARELHAVIGHALAAHDAA